MTREELREWFSSPVTKEMLRRADERAAGVSRDALEVIAADPTQAHKAAHAKGYAEAIDAIRSEHDVGSDNRED